MELTLFKKNNIKALYKHVDGILEKNGMNKIFPFEVPKDMKKEGALLALMKMNKDDYFSICTIRDLYQLHNVKIPSERMEFYKTLHCVSWGDMSPEFRESLNAMIFKDLEPSLNKE